MRPGLIASLVAVGAIGLVPVLRAPPAAGQEAGSTSGGAALGADQRADGSLLEGGGGAEVSASFEASTGTGDTATPNAGPAPGPGRSAGAQIRCSLWGLDPSESPGRELPTIETLRTLWDRRPAGTAALDVVRTCYDQAGNVVSADRSTWAPPADGEEPPLIDPAVLAAAARSRLGFPPPVPRTSPGLDTGTYAQLPTALWVEGWEASSSSASAGPVTATVTARPVAQEWRISDGLRGDVHSVDCSGPGAPPVGGQVGACGWTPGHSSAGQTTRGGSASEPCFPITVTVTWDVAWTANVPGAGGPLGEGTSSTDTCLVVAEVQALVSDTG